jgi:hypothetical protein
MDALGRSTQRLHRALTSVLIATRFFGLPDVPGRKAHSLDGARVGLNQRSVVKGPGSKYF